MHCFINQAALIPSTMCMKRINKLVYTVSFLACLVHTGLLLWSNNKSTLNSSTSEEIPLTQMEFPVLFNLYPTPSIDIVKLQETIYNHSMPGWAYFMGMNSSEMPIGWDGLTGNVEGI